MKPENSSVFKEVAEIQLVYKSKRRVSMMPQAKTSADIYRILRDHWSDERIQLVEEFKVILLNRANRILGIVPLSSGGVTSTVVDVKLILIAALKSNAQAIILAHNHPSGNLVPSEADIRLTEKVRTAGTYFDLKLLDHLIVTSEGYHSMADEGTLP